MIKSLFILTIILAFASEAKSSTYTFHTAGNYSEEANWDVFPGNSLNNGDTIFINKNCANILFESTYGVVIFGEEVTSIGIYDFIIGEEVRVSFLSSSLYIYTSVEGGIFDFASNYMIETPQLDTVQISLFGNGINTNGLPFWDVTYMDFFISGSQNSYLINNMVGKLTINGTIDILEEEFYINCQTEVFITALLESNQPFDLIITGNGSLSDEGDINFTGLSNVENIIIQEGGQINIKGSLFINY